MLTLQIGSGVFFNLTVAFGLIGLMGVLAQRKFLLPLWLLFPFFLDPRSAGGMALVPLSMLAAYGFDQLLAPALLSVRGREGIWPADRFVSLSIFVIALYLFFSAAIFGVGLAGASLSAADRETIAWVDVNIPARSNFLLLTGEQYSMKDPIPGVVPGADRTAQPDHSAGRRMDTGSGLFPLLRGTSCICNIALMLVV